MKIRMWILLFFVQNIMAAELYQPGLQARCFAMGGTCISHVRGATALYFNPAALARVEGLDFIIGQAQVGISKDTLDFGSQFQGNAFSLNDVNNLYGKTITADVTARAGFVIPNLGFGVYSNNYTSMQFSDPTFPTFKMNFISEYGYVLGGAYALDANSSLGASVRHIKRWGGVADVDISTLVGASANNLANNNFQNHGVGHALDLAFLTTLNHPLKPTFSLVWQDVGVTKFNMSSGVQDPPSQYDNLIFGVAIEHTASFFEFTHAFEYKFIRSYDEDVSKKIHLGTEATVGPLDLRAGLNQGYLTYGVGLDLWFFQLDAAAYATEMGAYAGQSRNDRYNLSLTFELDLDQSFKLKDLKGKKRRLNQRR